MSKWIDVASIEWLPLQKPYIVSQAAESALTSRLEKAGFDVRGLDGREIEDEESFFAQISRALGFPAYFGNNWDAFHDSFGDLAYLSKGPLAVVWREASRLLPANWPLLFRATHEILVASCGLGRSTAGAEPQLQCELFLVGSGPGFDARPVEGGR
jgi:RNAse (barnase) inhibitor barstar